jgi:hypothetical protein
MRPYLRNGRKVCVDVDDSGAPTFAEQTQLMYSAPVPDKAAPNALMFTWLRVFAGTFWAPAIPRLFIIGFTYAQPFLIQSAVEFAGTRKGMPYDNYGYGLIGAFVLVYAGQAVSSHSLPVNLR